MKFRPQLSESVLVLAVENPLRKQMLTEALINRLNRLQASAQFDLVELLHRLVILELRFHLRQILLAHRKRCEVPHNRGADCLRHECISAISLDQSERNVSKEISN